MVDCGIAWQVTGQKKYARRGTDMLKAYADLYPTLGFHPVTLSKPGPHLLAGSSTKASG